MKRLCSIITLLVSFLLIDGENTSTYYYAISLFGRYGVATTKLGCHLGQ